MRLLLFGIVACGMMAGKADARTSTFPLGAERKASAMKEIARQIVGKDPRHDQFDQNTDARFDASDAIRYDRFNSFVHRINVGGSDYTAPDGTFWVADRFFNTGEAYQAFDPIGGTDADLLYQTGRANPGGDPPLVYTLGIQPGFYRVHLHFAEFAWETSGSRVFNVNVNGLRVLTNFDMHAEAGRFNAIVKSFNIETTEPQLAIELVTFLDMPAISAIEVERVALLETEIALDSAFHPFGAIEPGQFAPLHRVNVTNAGGAPVRIDGVRFLPERGSSQAFYVSINDELFQGAGPDTLANAALRLGVGEGTEANVFFSPVATDPYDGLIELTGNFPSRQLRVRGTAVGAFANAWYNGPNMPVALGEVASAVIGNSLYVVGETNNATPRFDFETGTWAPTSAVPERPYKGHHHGAEVIDGKWYIFGGLHGGSPGRVQIYDPATNQWSEGATAPFLSGSACTALLNGEVYYAGGIIGNSTTNQHAKYNPVTNSWTMLAPMPRGRNHAATATDGRRVFVFGGRGPGSGDANIVANGFADVQVYDPATNTWTTSNEGAVAPLPIGRGGTGKAVYLYGEFFVFGGETANGPGAVSGNVFNRVDIYNPITNTWRLGTPMPAPRHGIFPVVYGGNIHLAGGGRNAGFANSNVYDVYVP